MFLQDSPACYIKGGDVIGKYQYNAGDIFNSSLWTCHTYLIGKKSITAMDCPLVLDIRRIYSQKLVLDASTTVLLFRRLADIAAATYYRY